LVNGFSRAGCSPLIPAKPSGLSRAGPLLIASANFLQV